MRQKSRRGTDKVIHVVFGPGGGRVEPRAEQQEAAAAIATELPDTREPITDLFSGSEVTRLLGLSAARLRTLDRAGIVSPAAAGAGAAPTRSPTSSPFAPRRGSSRAGCACAT